MRVAAKCGTYAGSTAHFRRGEARCEPCKAAAAAYQVQWRRGNGRAAARHKHQVLARSRALAELGRRYPDEFDQLYAAALAELEQGTS